MGHAQWGHLVVSGRGREATDEATEKYPVPE